MGKSKTYKGFTNAEDFFKELWGTDEIPQAHAMAKTDKDGEYAVFCPDGKNHKMKVTNGDDGPVFTLFEEEAQRPKRSFWDRIKSFFGFGESKQQFEERRDRFDQLGGGDERRNDYVNQYDKKLDFDAPTVEKTAVQEKQQQQLGFNDSEQKKQLDKMLDSKNPVLVGVAKEVKNAQTAVSQFTMNGSVEENTKGALANAMQKVAAFQLLSASEQAKQDFADKVESMGNNWESAFYQWSKEKFPNEEVMEKLNDRSVEEGFLDDFNSSNGVNLVTEMQSKNYPDINYNQPTDLSDVQIKREETVQVGDKTVKAKEAWEDAWRYTGDDAKSKVLESYKKANNDLRIQKMYAEAGELNPNNPMFRSYKQDEAVVHMQKIMAFRLINSAPDSKKVFENMMQTNTDPNKDLLGEFADKFVPKEQIKNAFPKDARKHGEFISECLDTCGKNLARRIVNSASKTNNNPVKEASGLIVGNN